MAMIAYTQFIGIRTAENGSNGFITNSTNYSMLVVYTNGSREIVEGDAHLMSIYLPYLKEDNTSAILQQSLTDFAARMERLVDERLERVFAVMYPIPDVIGLREDDAEQKLRAAGFEVVRMNSYPEGMPLGVVHSVRRAGERYLTVEMDVRHALPEVKGLPQSQAMALLERAGFRVQLVNTYPAGAPDGTVYSCGRTSETSVEVYLDVRHALPDVAGLPEEEAVALLKARGFAVAVNRKDRVGGAYVVESCDRLRPQDLAVTLTTTSTLANVTGMTEAEALRQLRAQGVSCEVRRRPSQAPVGQVLRWEMDGDTMALYVSIGDQDLTARKTSATLTSEDGAEFEMRNVTAERSWSRETLRISLEVMPTGKTRYTLTDYTTDLRLDGQARMRRCTVSQSSTVIEPERWTRLTLSFDLTQLRDMLPGSAHLALHPTVGVFKKSCQWDLDFKMDW